MQVSFKAVFLGKYRDELKSTLEQTKQIRDDMLKMQASFSSEVTKAIHGAYAGIVCAVCGKNVFRGEGTWVHGNGGKAYCLEPCWKELNKKESKK